METTTQGGSEKKIITSPLSHLALLFLVIVTVAGLSSFATYYYLSSMQSPTPNPEVSLPYQQPAEQAANNQQMDTDTHPLNQMVTSTMDLKTYTSSVEKAHFQYPAPWKVVKPAVESNFPDADQIGLQSPSGEIKISWISALNGFGGHCDEEATLGTEGACALVTVLEKTAVKGAPGFFVVAATITSDGKIYEPFLALQDQEGFMTTQRSMGYDMFTGKNNGMLKENRGQNTSALFSTAGVYAGGPSLTQKQSQEWFAKPEAKEAKDILLSLTY